MSCLDLSSFSAGEERLQYSYYPKQMLLEASAAAAAAAAARNRFKRFEHPKAPRRGRRLAAAAAAAAGTGGAAGAAGAAEAAGLKALCPAAAVAAALRAAANNIKNERLWGGITKKLALMAPLLLPHQIAAALHATARVK